MATFRDGARDFRRRRARDVLAKITTNYATQIAGNIGRVAPVDTGYLSQHIFKDRANPYQVRVFTIVPYAPYPLTLRRQYAGQRGRLGRRPRGRVRGFPPYWKLGQRLGTTRARQQNSPALREWLRSR